MKTLGWLMALACGVTACGGGAETAAQNARIEELEQAVHRVSESVAALQAPSAATAHPAKSPTHPFKVACLQPWLLHTPLGATLWSCRAPDPTPQGVFPQCNVSLQPQVEIETKNYFEFALNAAPQLLAVQNLQDKPTKINGADAFEATFEADPKPIPLKMMSALLPHGEATYAITCFAPKAAFADYAGAFRKIIDTFAFN